MEYRPAWQYVAQDMADMFEYYEINGHVSRAVAEAMGDLFETVPLRYRADVFQSFMNELDMREIEYNKAEFV